MTGKQMEELLQDPSPLKYAYTHDVETAIDYLIDNLVARANRYGLDEAIDGLSDIMYSVRDIVDVISYYEDEEDKEVTYGK